MLVSNTIVYGFGVNFSEKLQGGDFFILENPNPKQGEDAQESRKIIVVIGM